MRQKLSAAGILLLSLVLLFFLLVHPQEGLTAARSGMGLWLNTLIPTLLPFIILSSILIHTGRIEKLLTPLASVFQFLLGVDVYGGYVFLLGMLCGYPMGAKLASDLYEAGKIHRKEALYLTTFCNHASPAFVITYLGQHCLKGTIPVYWLFVSLLAADFLCMLFFRFFIYHNQTIATTESYSEQNLCTEWNHSAQKEDTKEKKETSAAAPMGNILDVSIMNGFETITRLGGYILLFSILAGCIRHYWPFPPVYQYLLLGFTEITTGLNLIGASDLPINFCCVLSVTAAASGGLCILAQTRSVMNQTLSVLPYATSKCINAALAGTILYCILTF